jgi:predicted acylesterase/phospholipase RssA
MSAEIKSIIADKNNSGTKRSLILAGGGMRLAYQAGVLQALQEANLQFSHFDGTSGGIFNTAMLASGVTPDEMAVRWRALDVKHFMSYRPLKAYFNFLKLDAFGDADGIRNKVFPALGINLQRINSNQKIVATFNVCNFSEKSVEAIPHHEVTEDHLIAGMSLPIFMPALKIKTTWYTDAVWIKDANLMEAVKRGAEELWLVWAIGNNSTYLPGSFNQYVHMIEMSANGGLLEEYAQINLINERIVKGDSPYGQRAPIRLYVIKPEYPLPLDPDLFFDKIDTNTLVNMGYADAKHYLHHLPIKEVAFDNASTKMKDPGVTLSFRQHFTGSLRVQNKISAVRFSPSFNLRYWDNKLSLQHQSSLFVHCFGKEIATRNNTARVERKQGYSNLTITSAFEVERKTYTLRASIPLTNSIDWFLGLTFKQVKITITAVDTSTVLLEGNLTQRIHSRFKNLFSVALRNYYGGGLKVKEKYKMIDKLFTHEI